MVSTRRSDAEAAKTSSSRKTSSTASKAGSSSSVAATKASSRMAVKSLFGHVIKFTSAVILVLLLVCVARVLIYFPTPKAPEVCSDDAPSTAFAKLVPGGHVRLSDQSRPGLIKRFSRALSFKTITRGKHMYDSNQLLAFIDFLRDCELSTLSSFITLFVVHLFT